jgi:hypothetical protein
MPQGSSRLPTRITLAWGRDRLLVEDPIWIAKIVQDMAEDIFSTDEVRFYPYEPRSLRNERINASLVAAGLHTAREDSEAHQAQIGYKAPELRDGAAAEALRVFLGLELPVALNFTNLSGRSEHRMSAVETFFRRCWNCRKTDELELEWVFNGYQLYASHSIGGAHHRPYGTENMGYVERRLLSGQWVHWGFDGASAPPPGRHWSSNFRTFILASSGIQRIGQRDSDLLPEYDHRDFENDVEEGIYPSQEAT